MTAVFEAVQEWWEMKFFKNMFDGVYCPYRKGLILVWLYVVWCLQYGLNFITNKIQTLKALNFYSNAKLGFKYKNYWMFYSSQLV